MISGRSRDENPLPNEQEDAFPDKRRRRQPRHPKEAASSLK
jgi:hypothetical protein